MICLGTGETRKRGRDGKLANWQTYSIVYHFNVQLIKESHLLIVYFTRAVGSFPLSIACTGACLSIDLTSIFTLQSAFFREKKRLLY